MKNNFTIFIFFIFLKIAEMHRYGTFNDEINSIYGTGDTGLDKEYRGACRQICENCCRGSDISALECLSPEQCRELNRRLDKHLAKLIIGLYFGLLLVTSIVIFGIFTFISKRIYNGVNPLKNGLASGLLVLFGGLVLPLVILFIISHYKKTSITKLLGGSFHNISTNVLVSVKTKLSEREKKYLINSDEDSPNVKPIETNI
jgi:hypothetical protein